MFEVQEQSRQKNISINYKKPENPLPLCEGDVKKIKFILYRLLDNAVKYSEEGKDICEVRKTIDMFYEPNKHLGTETPMPEGCV